MSKLTVPESVVKQRVRHAPGWEERLMQGLVIVAGLWLVIFVVLPLYEIVSRSFLNKAGEFVGLANYLKYFTTPSLSYGLYNSMYISITSTIITDMRCQTS